MNLLMQMSPGGSGTGGADVIGLVVALLFIFIIFAAMVALWGMIFSKAGYSFWFGLLMFVPLANLIWLLIFAFSKWPIQQELERLRAHAAGSGYGYGTGGFPVGQPGGYAPPQPPQSPQQQYGQR